MSQKRNGGRFSKIHTDMDELRHELKADMKILKEKVKEIERSIEFTQGEVDLLKEDVKAKDDQTTKLKQSNEELDRRISELTKKLKEEEEKNIQLEQYTRRENLRFNNIPESEDEDCKSLVYDIIDRDLEIDTTCIRFHAVHRVGRKKPGRIRPIIARFACREDRDSVWQQRKKLKGPSTLYSDTYITQDYARTIQKERGILIQAMLKARKEKGLKDVRVIDRFLIVNNQRYTVENIPDYIK